MAASVAAGSLPAVEPGFPARRKSSLCPCGLEFSQIASCMHLVPGGWKLAAV